MNKMVVWFHTFPDEPEVIIDSRLFEQIKVSAFMAADVNQKARMLFNGKFNQFIDYVSNNQLFDNVEIVLPAKEVIYTKVSIPSKSRNRILQALPFLLDDSLIHDIDKQFFALGEVKSGQCNIAIISRFIISKLFEQFKKLTLPVSIMTSEVFQLPWYQNKWTIAFAQDNVFIRTGAQSGMTTGINNIDFVFGILLNNTLPQEDESEFQANEILSEKKAAPESKNNFNRGKPDSVIIYAQNITENVEKIKAVAQKYSIVSEMSKGNLLTFALAEHSLDTKKHFSQTRGINLLQGEYHPDNIQKVKIPFLKSLIAIFLLWLLSQIFFMSYQWYAYKNESTELTTKLEQMYFNTFPDSKRLIDVRLQAESKLKKLQKKSAGNDSFLNLFALVGDEFRHHKDIKIQSLRYSEGILQLDILSRGFVFNKLKSSLQSKHKLVVEEKSSSKIKDKVHSILNFKMNNP